MSSKTALHYYNTESIDMRLEEYGDMFHFYGPDPENPQYQISDWDVYQPIVNMKRGTKRWMESALFATTEHRRTLWILNRHVDHGSQEWSTNTHFYVNLFMQENAMKMQLNAMTEDTEDYLPERDVLLKRLAQPDFYRNLHY